MICTPLHAFECNVLSDGAAAFIVTSAERAKDITRTPVYPLGFGSIVTHFNIAYADMATLGYPRAAKEAYEMAGIGPKDVDVAELYDSYPVIPLIALEGLGLCEKGGAGSFIYEGNTWPGGKLPMTTNGGMLSQGHTGAGGGVAILIEAVRQLMGKAGERQVKNAKILVETSTGGYYMDAHVAILGREVP
jgi:acetyl-CoA acetyltransferase